MDTIERTPCAASSLYVQKNAPGSGDTPVAGSGAAVRRALGLEPSTPMVLYTGTFEAYQGLDLLFASMKSVLAARPGVRLVLDQPPAQRDGQWVQHLVAAPGHRPGAELGLEL